MKKYDVAIVGAGPGGIYAAYELMKKNSKLSVVVLEAGHSLEKRHCPIDGKKIKSCISCKSCSIMSGFEMCIRDRGKGDKDEGLNIKFRQG